MDLRHDIPILAFIGPIENHTPDDDDPSNAKVLTYLSRPIQQSTLRGTKQIIARAREDFLNRIARPHIKFRGHRYQSYIEHKAMYTASVSQSSRVPDYGPWNPDQHTYTQLLYSTNIAGVPVDEIDPLSLPPIIDTQSQGTRSFGLSMYTQPSPPPSPFSQRPTSAAASPRQQQTQQSSLQDIMSSLTLQESTPRAGARTRGSTFDPTEWGVRQVPGQYRISPAVDFILAANDIGDATLAMVKCILGEERYEGHTVIEQLSEILGFGLACTVACIENRLHSRM